MSSDAFVERATEAANEAKELSNELARLATEASRLAAQAARHDGRRLGLRFRFKPSTELQVVPASDAQNSVGRELGTA